MSKSKVKGGKPTKASDVLSKVKSGNVTRPAQSAKAKSKDAAKGVSKKEEKVKKIVKQPTPSDSEDGDSSDESASGSESETEVQKPVLKGKSSTIKPAAKEESDSDSDSEDSASDDEVPKTNGVKVQAAAAASADESDSDASEDDSEEDEKPAVSAVMGAKVKKNEVESSEESDSEDEKPALKQVPKVSVAARAESGDDSDDESSGGSESEVEASVAKAAPKANGVPKEVKKDVKAVTEDDSEEGSDSAASDSDSDESEEEKTEVKPKAAKRKADEQPERATKKAKAEEAENGPNLFVGNLSWNVTEEWLREEFEEYGELSGVRLMTDRDSGRSKGFGYVEFVNAADAAKAHEAKAGAELDGRAMNVDYSNPRPNDKQRNDNRSKSFGDSVGTPSDTIFVGNLPFSADADMVTQAFEPHGTISGIRLPTDRETERPRGFGYVTFASVDEAKAALEAMTGFYLDGRPLRLDYSQPRDNNSGGGGDSRGGFGGRGRGGFDRGGRGGGRGRGGFDRGGRGGGRGRGGFDRGGRGGGRGGSTNRGGFGDFSGKKVTF